LPIIYRPKFKRMMTNFTPRKWMAYTLSQSFFYLLLSVFMLGATTGYSQCPTSGPDKDNDNIPDFFDADSDNDGISNIDEGVLCETFDISSLDGTSVGTLDTFNNAQLNLAGAILQVEDPLTLGGIATIDEFSINDEHETGSFGLQLGVNGANPANYLQSNYTFSQPVCDFNARIVDVDRTDALVVFGYLNGQVVPFSINTVGSCLIYDNANTFLSICNVQASPTIGNVEQHAFNVIFNGCIDSLTFRIYDQGQGNGGSFTFIVSPDPTCSGPDFDGDGVPDYLDLDSDNDGIPDAIEACGNFNLNLEGCSLDNDGSAVYPDGDGDGCPDGIVQGACATAPIDTDGDGSPDYLDLDSDGDGCADATEAEVMNPNVNFNVILNPAAVIDECGLVQEVGGGIPGTCHTPPGDAWIDAAFDGCNTTQADNDFNVTLPDTPVSGNVLTNDEDIEGDNQTVNTTPVSGPTNGTLVLNADGTYTYSPNPGFFGEDEFTYEVCDDNTPQACDQATVYIEVMPPLEPGVNNPPLANPDNNTTLVDTPIDGSLLPNDSDPDGDPLTINTTPLSGPNNGTIVINPDGTYTYTPDPGFIGDDEIVYEVCDNGAPPLCDNTVLTVSVVPDDTPNFTNANDDNSLGATDEPQSGDLGANDTDAEGDNQTIVTTPVTPPSNGTIVINPDGTFVYTPNPGFEGNDEVVYQTCDNGNPVACDEATLYITVFPGNNPPVAQDDVNNTIVDTPVTGNVIPNDSDPDGDPLTVITTPVSGPNNGTVVINPDGTYTYTPDPGFIGTDTFEYEVCDSKGDCDQAIVTIDVIGIDINGNNPPIATNDATTTPVNTPIDIVILSNDSEPDGDNIVGPILQSSPSNGSVAINPDGSVTYTPNTGFTGTDEFIYQICDPFGLCDDAVVTIDVYDSPQGANNPPSPIDDLEITPINTPVSGDASVNDTEPDGDNTTYTQVTQPTNGTVVFNPDGTFTYTPDPGYVGPDEFVYSVCDDGTPVLCDEATVHITVIPENQPPVAQDDVNTTPVDTPVDGDVVTNDEDPEGGPLTVNTTPLSGPDNGAVVLNPDGTYTYTPDPGFSGTDTFEYEVCDAEGLCDTAIATIEIIDTDTQGNNPPIAINDAGTTPVDVPIVLNILANDSEPDGDSISGPIVILTQPTNGSVALNPDGTVTYTPNAGYTGTDEFTYQICDPFGLCDDAVVVIDIVDRSTEGHEPPSPIDDFATTPKNTPVSGTVADNDTEPDGDNLTWTQVTQPTNGTVVFNSDGTYNYTPNPGFTGSDQYVYEVCDDGNPILCDQATAYILVLPQNDPPLAQDDVNVTPVDTPVDGNVVTNDEDPEGGPLTVNTTPLSGPDNGSVVLNSDGTYTYTPDPAFTGTDTFEYEVCDAEGLCDTAVVTIDIVDTEDQVNDPPIAINDATTTPVDVPIILNILANDSEPDGDPITGPILVTSPSNGNITLNPDGTVTYTPDPGYTGTDEFEYRICDPFGLCDDAVVTIDITEPSTEGHEPPSPIDDFATTPQDIPVSGTVADNDTEPDGDNLTWTQVTQPTNGTVVFNTDGTYVYTPAPGYNGPDQYIYEICDDGNPILCDQATAYILVLPANQPPVAQDDVNTTPVDTPVDGDVITNDEDPEGGPLTVNTTPLSGPDNGSVVLNPDGTYTYTPDPAFTGTDTFEYEVCDADGECDTAIVTIDITNYDTQGNNPPIAINDAGTTPVDVPIQLNILANDSEPDGDPITGPILLSQPTNGSVTINPDGTVTYTPNAGYTGLDQFEYTICDPFGLCDDAVVVIDIVDRSTKGHEPPSPIDDFTTTPEDIPVSGTVADNDTEPDGDNLTWTQVTQPANGSVVFNSDGTYTYTPDPGYSGPDQYIYEVCDDGNPILCDQATAYILVVPVNAPPVAINDDNVTPVDVPVSGQILTNDFEPDGDNIVVTPVTVSNPSNGTLVFAPDGTYTYTPNTGYVGVDQFEYEICDDQTPALCDEAVVTITIIPTNEDPAVNDPPIANEDDNITYVDVPVEGTVLSNDYDPEGTPMLVFGIATPPSNGTATITPSGDYEYTPNPGFVGVDEFVYTVCDGGAPAECVTSTVYITVLPLPRDGNNLPPFAGDDFEVTEINVPVSDGVFANDGDPDMDPIIATEVGGNPILPIGTTITTANGSAIMFPNGSYTYTPNAGYSGPDQFTYQICDNISGCSDATVYIVILAPSCIDIQLKVLLEGALSDKNNAGVYLPLMRADLNLQRSILPGQTPVNPLVSPTPPGQPYSITPFIYTGTAAENAFVGPYDPEVVDWVLVSLRTGISPTTEFRQAAALVYRDGTVKFIEPCVITTDDPSQIYIIVEHRNHMGVMTPTPITVTSGSLIWDFTTQNSYVGTAGFGQKECNPGVWAMYAGDGNQDADFPSYDVNANDRILWKAENGNFDQYLLSDFNMNGDSNGADKLLWSVNNGFSSRVQK